MPIGEYHTCRYRQLSAQSFPNYCSKIISNLLPALINRLDTTVKQTENRATACLVFHPLWRWGPESFEFPYSLLNTHLGEYCIRKLIKMENNNYLAFTLISIFPNSLWKQCFFFEETVLQNSEMFSWCWCLMCQHFMETQGPPLFFWMGRRLLVKTQARASPSVDCGLDAVDSWCIWLAMIDGQARAHDRNPADPESQREVLWCSARTSTLAIPQ